MIILSAFSASSLFELVWTHMNYFYVFLFMTIESSFIPFPSEIVVPPAAYIAATDHSINVWGVGIAATAGALLGSIINYLLAMWLGRPIVYAFADSRLGSLFMINREKIDRAEKYFDRHGAASTFIGRLIPVIRQLISIPAGIARMNFGKFCLYTTAGAAIWNIILCWLGWFLSRSVGLSKDQLFNQIEYYNSYLSAAGWTLCIICVVYIIVKLLKPGKHNTPEHS